MILIAGGDSFVYGAELRDQTKIHSLSTFPAILAKENNFEYICAAWNGNANNAISRMTFTTCETYRKENCNIGAVVMWTFTNRYEFNFAYDTKHKISPWYSINPWSIITDAREIRKEFKIREFKRFSAFKKNIETANSTGITDFAKNFYKHIGGSEYYELYSSLKEILFLQYYFVNNNIPYLFVLADNQFFQHEKFMRRKDIYLESLYNQIDWNKFYFFDKGQGSNQTEYPRGFYQWAAENKYPMGTTHPLEDAHKDAATLIQEKFNELVKKPLEQNSIRN